MKKTMILAFVLALFACLAPPILADPAPAGVCAGVEYYDDTESQFRLFVLEGASLEHVLDVMELLAANCIQVVSVSLPVSPPEAGSDPPCGVITGRYIEGSCPAGTVTKDLEKGLAAVGSKTSG